MTFTDIPYEEVSFCIYQTIDRIRSATLAESPAEMAYVLGVLSSDLNRWLDTHCFQEESE
ncbi:MAG: hypothetical protein J6K69_07295 [Candidatus Methanomethylophilaceae archaeon]|nr:hypothetical protein [Candidatus Methanomethylophilaceae archaeon]